MTQVDAQASMMMVLKPPRGFETLYQGQPGTTPIPLVNSRLTGDDFVPLDDVAAKPGFASNLARFAPVPLGSSLMILLPRAIYADGATVRETFYIYDLRYRMKPLSAYARSAEEANPTHPYHALDNQGAPSDPAPTQRFIMPSYTAETVTPAVVGTNNRVLVAPGNLGTSSQGIYDPADFAGLADGGDLALGPNYFAPLLRPALGDELSVVIHKASGTWDFFGTGAGTDAGLSNIYGTNVAGPAHADYPGLGAYLISMSRSTTP